VPCILEARVPDFRAWRKTCVAVDPSVPAAGVYAPQLTWSPFDRLNVELVQNAAELRYQTWK
jgi:hypothetical protein